MRSTLTCKAHQLEEVDKLTVKIDLLMKKLENLGLDHLKMIDARVTCEECREMSHMGINCPMVPQDVNIIGNYNNGFHPNQGFNARWNKPSFPFDNRQQGGNGQNFNRNEPSLRNIITDQVRINDKIGKKIHATNKILENINAKMDSFTVAKQKQLSFNKMLETSIQQNFVAILSPSNGDSSKSPVQESVMSIFTVFKEKAPKPIEGSLGGVGKDKKSNAAENFLPKFSRRVMNATTAMTSSPVAPVT
jgi:hypothetical protein